MKKEARVLLGKSIDSLFLAVEHFNRPWDRGRPEAVLVLLDRSFELFLKAIIIYRGGRIRKTGIKETIGFDACVRKCVSDAQVKCLNEEQAITIQIINSLRDAAQHYLLELSEQQLYIYIQGGITLYDQMLKSVFHEGLEIYLPHRVLPISTDPPKEFAIVIKAEFDDIKMLLAPGSRRQLDAQAKLRSLKIIEESLSGIRSQPSEPELRRLIQEIRAGRTWQELFPGIAALRLDTTGTGLSVSLRITKNEGEPIRLVAEGTPGATVVAIKRVNELDFYSLGLFDLSDKLKISRSRALAIIRALDIQKSREYFNVFKIGSAIYKRYSIKCLDYLHKQLPNLNLDQIWKEYGPRKR